MLRERRTQPRVRHEVGVHFSPHQRGNLRGTLRDVSRTGAFLVSVDRVAPQADITVYLPLRFHDRQRLCILPGKVVRVEKGPAAGALGYGVRFTQAAALSSLRILEHFVRFKLSGRLQPFEEIEGAPLSAALRAAAQAPRPGAAKGRTAGVSRGARRVVGRLSALLGLAVSLAIVLSAGRWLFGEVREALHQYRAVSRLKAIVPLAHVSVADGVVSAQLPTDWLESTPAHARDEAYRSAAAELANQGFSRLILSDPLGKAQAIVTAPSEEEATPPVQLLP